MQACMECERAWSDSDADADAEVAMIWDMRFEIWDN